MISQREMLDIIRTEAIEGPEQGPPPERREPDPDEPSFVYDLRLVKKADGTLEWRD